MSRIREPEAPVLALLAGFASVLVGCSDTSAGARCDSQSDCAGDRVCVSGTCRIPGWRVQDAGPDGRAGGDTASPRDVAGEVGPPPRRDIDESDVPPVPDPPPDVGGGSDAGRPDLGVDGGSVGSDAGGGGSTLSCHEYATCSYLSCGRFGQACKADLAARTPDRQLSQLDERRRCVTENCGDERGLERRRCLAEKCASEWKTCADDPAGGGELDCAQFHACLDLCNGREGRSSCRADCRVRASDAATRVFQQYQQCMFEDCQGTEGRKRLECAQTKCATEIADCWDC